MKAQEQIAQLKKTIEDKDRMLQYNEVWIDRMHRLLERKESRIRTLESQLKVRHYGL